MPRFQGLWVALGALVASGCYTGFQGDNAFGSGPGAEGGDDAADTGNDSGEDPDDPAELCRDEGVGPTALKRLTAAQYDNAVRDLFGLTTGYAATFSPDERVGPFKSNSIAPVGELQVEQYLDAAETVATDAVSDIAGLVPCDPASGDATCARAYIEELAPKAYRRPLDDAEITALVGVYEDGNAEGGFENGIRVVTAGILQSPWFLYHVEFGDGSDNGEVQPLTDHEVAARLSFFLWNTIPDDTLREAADAGELTGAEALEAQVDRMLEDPKAREAIGAFHQQWLGVDELELVEKDAAVYPAYSETLADAMKQEMADFANGIILDGNGKVNRLLRGSVTYSTDDELLSLYGVTLPPGHQPGDPIDLDPDQRAGLLTLPGVLASAAHANQTSPVHRGVLIRQNILCQTLPPPPPDVDNVPPDPDPNATTRERFSQHNEDPSCAACHALIDGLGFGLEHYDGIGAWRDMEGDLPVDASGQIISTDVDGAFDGAIELADILATSQEVKDCVQQQWFRFVFARLAHEDDECSVEQIGQAFADSDYDVRVLLKQIALSHAFRHRRGE